MKMSENGGEGGRYAGPGHLCVSKGVVVTACLETQNTVLRKEMELQRWKNQMIPRL